MDPEEDEPTHCYRIRSLEHPRLGELEVSAFLCGRLGPPCVQCRDVSEVLCDFPLGDEGRTCDRALCLRCAPEVGVDKNYCAEHMEMGPGLILFPLRQATHEQIVEMAEPPRHPRAKRLPRSPPSNLRWRVLKADYSLNHLELGVALTRWMTEASARAWAAERGGIVESWEHFVVAWRTRYPLKRPPRKPKS